MRQIQLSAYPARGGSGWHINLDVLGLPPKAPDCLGFQVALPVSPRRFAAIVVVLVIISAHKCSVEIAITQQCDYICMRDGMGTINYPSPTVLAMPWRKALAPTVHLYGDQPRPSPTPT
jgi:hypothetical protein